MKKFVLTILITLGLMSGMAKAQEVDPVDLFKASANFKQGVMYNVDQDKFQYISTMPVAEIEGFNLEIGYAEPNALIAGITSKLYDAKENGVEIPILDLIKCNVGIIGGIDRVGSGDGNNEFIWGSSVTLMELQF